MSMPPNVKSSSRFASMLNAFCNGYQPDPITPAKEIYATGGIVPKEALLKQPGPPPQYIPRTAFDKPCKHNYEFLKMIGSGSYVFYCRHCIDIQTREF